MNDKRREELAQLYDEFAQQLRQQREAVLEEVAEGEADLRSMESERASELEERAQAADATRMFAHLDERRKQQIDEIDRALQRIALGSYGICLRCGEPIPRARLRALPTAVVHVQCTPEDEQGPPLMTEEETPPLVAEAESLMASSQVDKPPAEMEAEERPERMPPDISGLSDEEIEEYIREQLVEDGRVALDELQMTYRSGVIALEGALPSEEQHQILRQYVTDFAGVQEIIDRLVINELLWEREGRTDQPEDEETPSGTLSEAMEDMLESDQEGRTYEPPAGPVQEQP